jgi:alpha-1,2-mannosyltransferase
MTASRLTGTLAGMNTCRANSWLRTARSGRVATDFVDLLRGSNGWTMLAFSIATYAAVSIAMHQPFHAEGLKLRYFDLRIYHLAALRLAHGSSLYTTPMLDHLGFTYPPFAALLLAPLAWVPLYVDELAVLGLNVVLLVWILRRTLMLTSRKDAAGRPTGVVASRAVAWSQAAGLAAAALWLEPISVTLGYGQINLLITALVVFDLARPDEARTKGFAVGVAAAIKLTPLLFIAYLLLSRRRRAAGVAAITFIASIVLSFVVDTRDASAYWFHTIFQTGRIGNASDPANQSLHGAIARLTGSAQLSGGWELLIVAITVCGLALAVAAGRRGDEAAGFSLAAVSALLASPISWSHHWTLAVPALVLLARRAYEQRSRALEAAASTRRCAHSPSARAPR